MNWGNWSRDCRDRSCRELRRDRIIFFFSIWIEGSRSDSTRRWFLGRSSCCIRYGERCVVLRFGFYLFLGFRNIHIGKGKLYFSRTRIGGLFWLGLFDLFLLNFLFDRGFPIISSNRLTFIILLCFCSDYLSVFGFLR